MDCMEMSEKRGDLIRVTESIDPLDEMGVFIARADRSGSSKAILFEKAKGSDFPVQANTVVDANQALAKSYLGDSIEIFITSNNTLTGLTGRDATSLQVIVPATGPAVAVKRTTAARAFPRRCLQTSLGKARPSVATPSRSWCPGPAALPLADRGFASRPLLRRPPLVRHDVAAAVSDPGRPSSRKLREPAATRRQSSKRWRWRRLYCSVDVVVL
jgi:hypothetical protein